MEYFQKYGNVLSRTKLFHGQSDETLKKSLSLLDAEFAAYTKNSFVHPYGCAMKKFGLVLCGRVTVCTDDIDGNRMIMANVTAGSTFGESLALLKIHEPDVYVLAGEDTEMLWLSPDYMLLPETDEHCREMKLRFSEMLAGRTLNMNDRIQILSKLTLRDKLLTYFGELSRKSQSKTFTVPLDREQMAEYIGANRSALSRELSKMQKDGIITYRKNKITII